MIGFILITHNNIGHELLKTVEQIIEKNNQIKMISIRHDDDLEVSKKTIKDTLAHFSGVRGVILLLDLFGATPANLCNPFLSPDKVEMVTGCNLPMVIKAATSPFEGGPAEVAQFLKKYGQEHIRVLSSKF